MGLSLRDGLFDEVFGDVGPVAGCGLAAAFVVGCGEAGERVRVAEGSRGGHADSVKFAAARVAVGIA